MVVQMSASSEAKSVLIADDHAVLCDALAAVLGEQGYVVFKSHDKHELLKILDHHGPENFTIILYDVNMPGLAGLKSIRAVCHAAKKVPVAHNSS